MSSKEKWNDRYRAADKSPVQAARVLSENLHLLPRSGIALDLACGRGGNALLLAEQGLQVNAWDISNVVISDLRQLAEDSNVMLAADVRDVESEPPSAEQFDVIVVSYFLDRDSMPALAAALKPGGLIFYQTFTRERVSSRGPQRDAFRLARQELLQQFSSLELVVYREEGLLGNTRVGCRDEVMYIGKKPLNHPQP